MDDEKGAVKSEDLKREQDQEIGLADTVVLKMLTLPSNRCPFEDWYKGFRDAPTRQRIRARLNRLMTRNYGDFKLAGNDVYEIRLDFGSGYRIYFARVDDILVVLLGGVCFTIMSASCDRVLKVPGRKKRASSRRGILEFASVGRPFCAARGFQLLVRRDFIIRNHTLLGGGDKSTQQKDIVRAIDMWKEHKNDAERFQNDFSG